MGMIQEIEVLQKKANNYDNLKERYEKLSKKLDTVIELIKECQLEVEPFRALDKRNRTTKTGDIKGAMENVLSLLKGGASVTFETISLAHKDLDKAQVYYVMRKLKECDNVKSTPLQNNAKNIKLFMNKTY